MKNKVRLVKIAKDLNVGTAQIVNFLSKFNITIPNKPITKLDKNTQAMVRLRFGSHEGKDEITCPACEIEIKKADVLNHIEKHLSNYTESLSNIKNDSSPPLKIKNPIKSERFRIKPNRISKTRKRLNELKKLLNKTNKLDIINNKQSLSEKSVIRKSKKYNNWDKIEFQNGGLLYDKNLFKNGQSKKILNHLKPFFHTKKFKYKLEIINGKIKTVIIPREVFDLIDLAKTVDNILNINDKNNISELSFSLTKFDLKISDILSIFKKSKTYYLEYLFGKHVEGFQIKFVSEPIFSKNTFIRSDASFLFILGNATNPVIVWESIEPDKASYVFKLKTEKYEFEKILNTVESFLLLEEPSKRDNLGKNNIQIEGVSAITKLNHKYKKSNPDIIDYTWRNNLNNLLPRR